MNKVELRELRYFVSVAKMRSFTLAATELHMAQPPLSNAIRKLEGELGVTLFSRTSQGVLLTAEGSRLLREAEIVLARVAEISGVVRNEGRGLPRIRIGCVTSALSGLLPLVIPALDDLMEPVVYAMQERVQVQALRDREVEFGIHRSRGGADLVCFPLFEEHLYVALPENHPQAKVASVDIATLAGEAFIMFPRERAPIAFDAVTSVCHRAGFSPRVTHSTDSDQMTFGLIACGLGVSLVPATSTRMRLPGVVCVPVTDASALTPLAVLVNADGPVELARSFADRCRRAWSHHLADVRS